MFAVPLRSSLSKSMPFPSIAFVGLTLGASGLAILNTNTSHMLPPAMPKSKEATGSGPQSSMILSLSPGDYVCL
ncbi:hypothetical protein K7432_010775 [Basidiobolus ranarum]|uniref:Uncharacterized protein n=1 Tax=Basidiobolus ranarum TaxID=34480 RepID=A0ABR2VUW1_9FUNG